VGKDFTIGQILQLLAIATATGVLYQKVESHLQLVHHHGASEIVAELQMDILNNRLRLEAISKQLDRIERKSAIADGSAKRETAANAAH
jgi:hypothetical protein